MPPRTLPHLSRAVLATAAFHPQQPAASMPAALSACHRRVPPGSTANPASAAASATALVGAARGYDRRRYEKERRLLRAIANQDDISLADSIAVVKAYSLAQDLSLTAHVLCRKPEEGTKPVRGEVTLPVPVPASPVATAQDSGGSSGGAAILGAQADEAKRLGAAYVGGEELIAQASTVSDNIESMMNALRATSKFALDSEGHISLDNLRSLVKAVIEAIPPKISAQTFIEGVVVTGPLMPGFKLPLKPFRDLMWIVVELTNPPCHLTVGGTGAGVGDFTCCVPTPITSLKAHKAYAAAKFTTAAILHPSRAIGPQQRLGVPGAGISQPQPQASILQQSLSLPPMASTALVPPPIRSTQGMLRPPSPSASRQSRSDPRRSPVSKHAFLALTADLGVDPLTPMIATSAGPPQAAKHAEMPITLPMTQQPLSSGKVPTDFDLRARRRSSLGLGLLDGFGTDLPTSGIWVDRALSDHDFAQLLPSGTLQESTTSAQQASSSLTGLLPTDFFSLRGAFAGYTEHQIETMYSEPSTSNLRSELSEPQPEPLEFKESGRQQALQSVQSTNGDMTGDTMPSQSITSIPLFPSITEQLSLPTPIQTKQPPQAQDSEMSVKIDRELLGNESQTRADVTVEAPAGNAISRAKGGNSVAPKTRPVHKRQKSESAIASSGLMSKFKITPPKPPRTASQRSTGRRTRRSQGSPGSSVGGMSDVGLPSPIDPIGFGLPGAVSVSGLSGHEPSQMFDLNLASLSVASLSVASPVFSALGPPLTSTLSGHDPMEGVSSQFLATPTAPAGSGGAMASNPALLAPRLAGLRPGSTAPSPIRPGRKGKAPQMAGSGTSGGSLSGAVALKRSVSIGASPPKPSSPPEPKFNYSGLPGDVRLLILARLPLRDLARWRLLDRVASSSALWAPQLRMKHPALYFALSLQDEWGDAGDAGLAAGATSVTVGDWGDPASAAGGAAVPAAREVRTTLRQVAAVVNPNASAGPPLEFWVRRATAEDALWAAERAVLPRAGPDLGRGAWTAALAFAIIESGKRLAHGLRCAKCLFRPRATEAVWCDRCGSFACGPRNFLKKCIYAGVAPVPSLAPDVLLLLQYGVCRLLPRLR
ncbi:hypothetical protein HK405_003394 [Cladochytrium tenue]|nr:hypothetical protein HK405_003394 [Cladochytrium tenue]